MRALIFTLLLAFVLADEDGQYRPENYPNNGDDGRYVPDYSGRYIPDNSGLYQGDNSGLYADDGTGKYTGKNLKYRNERYGEGAGSSGKSNFGIGGRYGGNSNAFRLPTKQISASSPTANLLQAATETKAAVPSKPTKSGAAPAIFPFDLLHSNGNIFGNIPEGTAHNPSRRFPAQDYSRYNKGRYDADGKWRIIKQSGDVGSDGYHWEYETENGIVAEESAKLANKGSDLEAIRAKGFFKYTGPDNVVYTVTYTADENGFVPQGKHLPTPPPIPAAILKSLEYKKGGKL